MRESPLSCRPARKSCAILLFSSLLILLSATVQAQDQRLRIEIPDTTVAYVPGVSVGQEIKLPVWFDNYQDTIAGFNILLQLDRSDLLVFPTDLEIDSAGTLISGWEYFSSLSLSGMGFDANVVGLADMPGLPITPGFPPQTGHVLVFPVLKQLDIPAQPAATALIITQRQFIDHFSFSDPQGNTIGLVQDTVIDSLFFGCTEWLGDTCLNWQRVSMPPYDSLVIDTNYTVVFDSATCTVIDGSVTLVMCADANGDGAISVADLTLFISYLFRGCGPDCPIYRAAVDLNGDGSVQISDLTAVINYLFRSGPAPLCGVAGP